MHKKSIAGSSYYYTTYRNNKGEHRTHYLGKDFDAARRREQQILSQMRGLKSSSYKNLCLSLMVICGLILISFSGQMTGFFSYEPSTIEFDVNASWNISDTLVRVSIGNFSIDLAAADLLANDKLIVDARTLQLNTTGRLYADLIVNNELVDSKHIDITEEANDAPDNQSEILPLEPLIDNTPVQQIINQTAQKEDKPKQYKKAHEIAAKIMDKKGIEGSLITETDGDRVNLRATKDKTKLEIKGLRTTTDFEIRADETDGKAIVAILKNNKTEEIEVDNATITLPKTKKIRAIGYCPDEQFNFDTFSCAHWQATSIPFVDNGDTITFTVEHFSAYSGLSAVTLSGVNLSKYSVATGQAVNYSGLIAWYKLEKGNGSSWNDSSGNGNFMAGNGTLAAAPTHTYEGSTGGAYKFDGIDDFITNGTSTISVGEFTLAAWLKINKEEIKNVTTGQFHSCSLMYNGDVYCWGENTNGQLGDGTTTNSTIPVKIQMTAATQLSSGSLSTHTCAVNSSGMYCWGYNGWGSVGDGTTAVRTVPTKSFMTSPTGIAVGNSVTCAMNTSGMYCWGYNAYGTIGNSSIANANEFPTLNHMTAPTLIALDYLHACATNTSGMYCWGYNTYGSLGNGSTGDTAFVTKNYMTAASQIDTGGFHTCAVNNSGMYCWGNNAYGQLGNGSSANNNEFPTKTNMNASGKITAGQQQHCAVNTSGMYCWGDSTNGQLGDGTTTQRIIPTQNQMASATDLSGGQLHTCAANSSGAYCFGLNAGGQVGNGSVTDALSPQATAFEILTLTRKTFSMTPDWTGWLINNISRTSTTIKETMYGNNNWQLLTITKNSSNLKAYRNGVEIYNADNSSSADTTLTTIGRLDVSSYFNGSIDELTIWNRSLSAQEVLNIYNRSKNIYTRHDLGASIVNSSEPASNTSVSYVFDWRLFNSSIALVNMPFDLNGSVGAGNWTTVADYSSFANHAEYSGSISTMPRWNRTGGYDGRGAYEFDGINKVVYLKNSFPLPQNMTISLWAKWNNTAGNALGLIDIDNAASGGSVAITTDTTGQQGRLGLANASDSTTGQWTQGLGSNLNKNTWHHIAVTRQAGTFAFYIHGKRTTTLLKQRHTRQ